MRFEYQAADTCQAGWCDDAYGRAVLDDVSLTATPLTAPEKGTWALVGTGMLLVGGVAATRRRGASRPGTF